MTFLFFLKKSTKYQKMMLKNFLSRLIAEFPLCYKTMEMQRIIELYAIFLNIFNSFHVLVAVRVDAF